MLRGLEPGQLKWAEYVGKIDAMRDLLEKCRKFLECQWAGRIPTDAECNCGQCLLRKEIVEFQLTDT